MVEIIRTLNHNYSYNNDGGFHIINILESILKSINISFMNMNHDILPCKGHVKNVQIAKESKEKILNHLLKGLNGKFCCHCQCMVKLIFKMIPNVSLSLWLTLLWALKCLYPHCFSLVSHFMNIYCHELSYLWYSIHTHMEKYTHRVWNVTYEQWMPICINDTNFCWTNYQIA